MDLKENINAKELVALIYEKKNFANRLLKNSMINNDETGEFEARIRLDTIDFCLNQILKLQTEN